MISRKLLFQNANIGWKYPLDVRINNYPEFENFLERAMHVTIVVALFIRSLAHLPMSQSFPQFFQLLNDKLLK